MKYQIAISILAISLSGPAAAQSDPILRLQCVWSSSLDTATMTSSPTSGSKMITVEMTDGRSGRLTKEGLGAQFSAVITDEQIEAETAYQIGRLTHRERIVINRYTGKLQNWIVIGKAELVHSGMCKQLPGRLF